MIPEPAAIGVRGFGFLAAARGALLPDDVAGAGRRFRKIGRFIKLALAGAEKAVERASPLELPKDRTGVFLGTGLGNLPDLIQFAESVFSKGELFPSPIQFASSVGNSGAFYIAQAFGLVGPVLAISQDELSFECALLNAEGLIRTGAIDFALVGGVDVFWPTVEDQRVRMGYAASWEGAVGEGSGWLLLERLSSRSVAVLESVVVGEREAVLARPAPADVVALNSRLACEPVPAALGAIARFDAGFGAFLSESAATVAAFLEGARPGTLLHSLSESRDGQVGSVRLRVLDSPSEEGP